MKQKILSSMMLAGVFLTSACTTESTKSECCKSDVEVSLPENKAVSDESIFLLDTKWENYHHETKYLKDYRGKPIVAAMIFTHCPSACPRIVADMKLIESTLSPEERASVQFILISMDPERDTPEQMQQFSNDHQLNDDWEMIRADEQATMEIANVLNVRIKSLPEGGFDHSNIIQIINREGEIVFQQNGLNINPGKSLEEIRKLI